LIAPAAETEVIVQADIVILQKSNQPSGIAIDPIHSHDTANTAIASPADIVPESGEQGKTQHRFARRYWRARIETFWYQLSYRIESCFARRYWRARIETGAPTPTAGLSRPG